MIEERAAADAVAERPAHGVLNKPALEILRRNLPQLFQSDSVLLRLAVLRQPKARNQRLRKTAARAFGEQRIFGAQFHAARETGFLLPVLADAHVAGRD